MLTGNEIKLQVASGRIVIQPFDEENIGPNSYLDKQDGILP